MNIFGNRKNRLAFFIFTLKGQNPRWRPYWWWKRRAPSNGGYLGRHLGFWPLIVRIKKCCLFFFFYLFEVFIYHILLKIYFFPIKSTNKRTLKINFLKGICIFFCKMRRPSWTPSWILAPFSENKKCQPIFL